MEVKSKQKPCPVLGILLAEFSLNLPAHIRSVEEAEQWMQDHASNELEWMRRVAEEIKSVVSPAADVEAIADLLALLDWKAKHPTGPRVHAGFAIHHIDGNPDNNDPENLRLVGISENRRATNRKETT